MLLGFRMGMETDVALFDFYTNSVQRKADPPAISFKYVE